MNQSMIALILSVIGKEWMSSKQLTIDFKAVSHARLWYVNQFGETIKCKPKNPTVHGVAVKHELAPALLQYPYEMLLERANRLGIVDRWIVHCALQLRNNHSLSFVGNKAKQMFKAYNASIYGDK